MSTHSLSMSLSTSQDRFDLFSLSSDVHSHSDIWPVDPPGSSETVSLVLDNQSGRMAPSPVSMENSLSSDEPINVKKRNRICAFFQRAWKAIKSPFLRCRRNRVEPATSDFLQNYGSVKSCYILGDLLGGGSFGMVFEGIRKSDGKMIAIKHTEKLVDEHYLVIPGCSKPLFAEVGLMLMVKQPPTSPHIIELYEWYDKPSRVTLIMEYPQPCESLKHFISDCGQITEPAARVLMCQAVLAAQHCIDHGVFHRDMHSRNFLVNKNTLKLKLIDFGCGEMVINDGYHSRKYRGAPGYCPPEVHTEPKYHAVPATVWSLGILLFEMLTGHIPFKHTHEILFADPKYPSLYLSKGEDNDRNTDKHNTTAQSQTQTDQHY